MVQNTKVFVQKFLQTEIGATAIMINLPAIRQKAK
jgi:hypothetical protein